MIFPVHVRAGAAPMPFMLVTVVTTSVLAVHPRELLRGDRLAGLRGHDLACMATSDHHGSGALPAGRRDDGVSTFGSPRQRRRRAVRQMARTSGNKLLRFIRTISFLGSGTGRKTAPNLNPKGRSTVVRTSRCWRSRGPSTSRRGPCIRWCTSSGTLTPSGTSL